MVYLKKKKEKKDPSVFTHREGPHFSFNSLTYTLVCATANICQADGRKQRWPLRKICRSYFEGFQRGEGRRLGEEGEGREGDEGGKIYLRIKKKKKGTGSSGGHHGKTTISCAATPVRTPQTQTL